MDGDAWLFPAGASPPLPSGITPRDVLALFHYPIYLPRYLLATIRALADGAQLYGTIHQTDRGGREGDRAQNDGAVGGVAIRGIGAAVRRLPVAVIHPSPIKAGHTVCRRAFRCKSVSSVQGFDQAAVDLNRRLRTRWSIDNLPGPCTRNNTRSIPQK